MGAGETSGDHHLGRQIHFRVLDCTWKHLVRQSYQSYLAAARLAPKKLKAGLWLDVQPCLAGTHGHTALADRHNIRLGRQDEVQVVL